MNTLINVIKNKVKGRVIPILIMTGLLSINVALTAFALEELPTKRTTPEAITVVPEPITTITDEPYNVVNQVLARSVVPETIPMENIVDTSLNDSLYDPIESYEAIEEMKRVAAELEAKRIAEEKRVAEEKRLAEEAERRRINQINNIKLSPYMSTNSNLTYEQIKYMLSGTGLEGTEWAYYNIQKDYGYNLFLTVAISINEAGWETNSYKANKSNNIYGITTGRKSFKSKQDCIYYFADFMDRLYLKRGLDHIRDIQPVYCPSPDYWDDHVLAISKKLYNKVTHKYK